MRYHRFKIDQTVVPSTPSLPPGRYTILRLLPLVHGEPHYRVMGKDDGRERAVLEAGIRLPGPVDDRLVHQPTTDEALAVS
jgi:hypothetical protein